MRWNLVAGLFLHAPLLVQRLAGGSPSLLLRSAGGRSDLVLLIASCVRVLGFTKVRLALHLHTHTHTHTHTQSQSAVVELKTGVTEFDNPTDSVLHSDL